MCVATAAIVRASAVPPEAGVVLDELADVVAVDPEAEVSPPPQAVRLTAEATRSARALPRGRVLIIWCPFVRYPGAGVGGRGFSKTPPRPDMTTGSGNRFTPTTRSTVLNRVGHPDVIMSEGGGEPVPLDEEAVVALYREHGPVLRRMALRACGDSAHADDLVQDVVLSVWRQAPEADNVRAYLARALRNRLIDEHRAAARRPRLVGSLSPDPDDRAADDVAELDDVDRTLDRMVISAALRRLSPEHRAVVVALHYEGLSVATTAERLGIPPGTVKSRAYYAVRHLRSVFDELGVTR